MGRRGIRRRDEAKAVLDAGVRQAALHHDQRVFGLIFAERGHMRDFFLGHGPGGVDVRRAPGRDEMLGQGFGDLLPLGLGDRGDGNDRSASEAFKAQPAVGEGLFFCAEQVRLGPVGEGKAAGDGPFARLGGGPENFEVGCGVRSS